jgi:SAM-dependent methyltransferase
MARVGSDISAQDRWRAVGASYAKGMAGPYHEHRLAVIKALLPDLTGKRLVDFGCGEGVMIREAKVHGARDVIGIDLDAGLLDLAKPSGADRLIQGSVEELTKLDRADCLLAANVAAYFADTEDETFYREARRLLPAGGALVVTHSNELFDLFTLNAFTAAFHERHFATDVRSLLTNPEVPRRLTFNIRENPLSYPDRMAALGFRIERMEFINFHTAPPLLTTIDYDDINSREYLDTLTVPQGERWKLMFQCSMFGVRAVRLAT